MKPRYYDIITRAVEVGVAMGYRHAHKHTATPDEGHALDCIHSAVMSELCEVFTFADELKSD